MARRVIVEHKDGRSFSIEPGDYDKKEMILDPEDNTLKSFEDAGFKITTYDNGEPYKKSGKSSATSSEGAGKG